MQNCIDIRHQAAASCTEARIRQSARQPAMAPAGQPSAVCMHIPQASLCQPTAANTCHLNAALPFTAVCLRLCVQHMVAGAAAGITEHTAMFPVDTIKTRMQALSHPGQRVSHLRTSRRLSVGWTAHPLGEGVLSRPEQREQQQHQEHGWCTQPSSNRSSSLSHGQAAVQQTQQHMWVAGTTSASGGEEQSL
jgi:hypothetical protein